MEIILTMRNIMFLAKKWFNEDINRDQAKAIKDRIEYCSGYDDLMIDESLVCDCICEILDIC